MSFERIDSWWRNELSDLDFLALMLLSQSGCHNTHCYVETTWSWIRIGLPYLISRKRWSSLFFSLGNGTCIPVSFSYPIALYSLIPLIKQSLYTLWFGDPSFLHFPFSLLPIGVYGAILRYGIGPFSSTSRRKASTFTLIHCTTEKFDDFSPS